MRSGAVGINLTAANHVFLMEPAFNPALEAQAIGRAHRMGQTRPVVVKKFYVKVCRGVWNVKQGLYKRPFLCAEQASGDRGPIFALSGVLHVN